MDGNGRWAQERGLPRKAGHEKGARALVRAITELNNLSIECVSFYAFSTDNAKRNLEEVGNILGIIAYFLQNEILPLAQKLNLQIRIIGDVRELPTQLAKIIVETNSATLNNKGMKVVLAIGYGGDKEVCNALDIIIKKKDFLQENTPITVEELNNSLYTVGLPNPDIVIRYGGQHRLSNFMPIQTIYSELFFLDTFWPDFDIKQINEIINKYNIITRNFGGLNG